MNNSKRWAVSIPSFPQKKIDLVNQLAKQNRQSVGAYIGNLLEEEIRKYQTDTHNSES